MEDLGLGGKAATCKELRKKKAMKSSQYIQIHNDPNQAFRRPYFSSAAASDGRRMVATAWR